MPQPIQFVHRSDVAIQSLQEGQAHRLLSEAMGLANQELENGKVVFLQQLSPEPPRNEKALDPRYNMLLGLEIEGKRFPIDMIDLRTIEQGFVKSPRDLAKEIGQKVRQHLAAMKVDQIVISSVGSKFDTRLLKHFRLGIDQEEYLLLNGHRIVTQSEAGYRPLKASLFRSYTIIRLVEEGESLRLFDDYDLVRLDKKGMKIENKVHHISGSLLKGNLQEGDYYVLERDTMTENLAHHFFRVLEKIPSP